VRVYFRWKLFLGFFGFAMVIAGLLAAWLLREVSGGHLVAGSPEVAAQLRRTLPKFLYWALLILGGASIPPALWIAHRMNRPIRLLHKGMQEVAQGRLDSTPLLRIRTYDEFEMLIEQFNAMVAGLRELEQHKLAKQLQQRVEEALRSANEQLEDRVRARTRELERLLAERERFLTFSMDLICLANSEGYFTEVNPAFSRVLGHSAEDLVSRPFVDFVHPDDLSATLNELGKLNTGASTLFFVNRYRCSDGSYKWLEWSAVPVPEQSLILAIARDITDRKRVEQVERTLLAKDLQLQIARHIQLSLLPKTAPCMTGFDIAAYSHPAEEVGGDYFDYLPMNEGRLGLVISDVVGHGIGSALVMAATRTCLRSLAATDHCSVEEIMERTNSVLHGSTPDNCFVTLTLLQLDPVSRVVRYLNCGHPTGYLLDSEGSVKVELASTGPPLGCFLDYRVDLVPEFPVETGDVLLLVTDGVTEAESCDGNFFGEQGALEVVRANLHRSAVEIVAAIQGAAREFSGSGVVGDDLTSLVVKVVPYHQIPVS